MADETQQTFESIAAVLSAPRAKRRSWRAEHAMLIDLGRNNVGARGAGLDRYAARGSHLTDSARSHSTVIPPASSQVIDFFLAFTRVEAMKSTGRAAGFT